ncbi:hypothetical protein LF941_02880 [Pectobacterium versatile]|uniref:glycosyltransferase family 8 protein n=1 Tax=Pectobacterium versatile TaxID=2488639 RepID=UPI000C7F1320|nr:glycosyltransferase [Pectobacterium versatile]MCA6914333.1 hypothetical protein [Pectobacterium versatile]PLY38644.1 hypothetical protein F164LOC_02155 [Pectobacterium carotovorum]
MSIVAAFCSDSNYCPLLETAFYSFAIFNPNSKVYIIKYDDFQVDKLAKIAETYSIVLETHLLVDEQLPAVGRFSKAMYGRLYLNNIIKESRFIYIDCDVVICGSLESVFSCKKANTELEMVEEEDSFLTNKRKNELNINCYFNSGVIIFNKINEINVLLNKTIQYLNEHAENLTYPDQDAINVVFAGKIKKLSSVYNYMGCSKSPVHPKIVHFAHFKPWGYLHKSFYFHEYTSIFQKNDFHLIEFSPKIRMSQKLIALVKIVLIKFKVFGVMQRIYWKL